MAIQLTARVKHIITEAVATVKPEENRRFRQHYSYRVPWNDQAERL